jgi:Creatinase/Prolidase N-terminal domain
MRRGLMRWDADELPKGTLLERIARLRGAMASAGLDAFVLYTNLVQPSAVTFLTGFTPYWSDGLLLVPNTGAPVFATALSKRVAGWIASTNPVSEIVNSPRPGAAVGLRLAADQCRRIGVLELDRLPGGLYDEIMGAAPALELIDASAAFAQVRRQIDAAERALIARADAIARAALGDIDALSAADAGTLAGMVEKHARLAGAEEAYIAVAADLDRDPRMRRVFGPLPLGARFALRASVAYKGSWVRRIRTYARDAGGQQTIARADGWFNSLLASLKGSAPLGDELATRIGELPGAKLVGFMAESTIGSYPLEVIASSWSSDKDSLPGGSFVVLTVELSLDDARWLGAAPAFV